MRIDALTVGFVLALALFFAPSGGHTAVSASSQIAYGANLTQMRPPTYDFALRPAASAFQAFSSPTVAIHDVAVTAVAPSKVVVGEGYGVNINVTAANLSDDTETFNLTVEWQQNLLSLAGDGVGEDYLLWQNGIQNSGTDFIGAWNALLSELSQWHFNTIRLSFCFADCSPNPDTGLHTHSVIDYAKMDSVITFLYSQGYRVILDFHNWNDMYEYCGSPSWHGNWQDVARHYSGDTRIIAFELFNEPYNNPNGNPLQLQTWYPQTIQSKQDLVRQYASLTDEIRQIDPTRTVVWPDPQDYFQDTAMTLLPTEAVRSNVIFAWHGWMGTSSYDNSIPETVQVATSKIVRMIWWQQQYPDSKQWLGEFGQYSSMNYTCQQAFCVTWVDACVSHGWGFSFWLWYENNGYDTMDTYPSILRASDYVPADTTYTATQNVTLPSGTTTTLVLTSNTSSLAYGNYTINAYAWPVPGETDTADNNCTGGWVLVSLPGDVTGPKGLPDGRVDMRDIGAVARLFGVNYPSPRYNPNYDINDDGKTDMKDIGIVARHFGQHYP